MSMMEQASKTAFNPKDKDHQSPPLMRQSTMPISKFPVLFSYLKIQGELQETNHFRRSQVKTNDDCDTFLTPKSEMKMKLPSLSQKNNSYNRASMPNFNKQNFFNNIQETDKISKRQSNVNKKNSILASGKIFDKADKFDENVVYVKDKDEINNMTFNNKGDKQKQKSLSNLHQNPQESQIGNNRGSVKVDRLYMTCDPTNDNILNSANRNKSLLIANERKSKILKINQDNGSDYMGFVFDPNLNSNKTMNAKIKGTPSLTNMKHDLVIVDSEHPQPQKNILALNSPSKPGLNHLDPLKSNAKDITIGKKRSTFFNTNPKPNGYLRDSLPNFENGQDKTPTNNKNYEEVNTGSHNYGLPDYSNQIKTDINHNLYIDAENFKMKTKLNSMAKDKSDQIIARQKLENTARENKRQRFSDVFIKMDGDQILGSVTVPKKIPKNSKIQKAYEQAKKNATDFRINKGEITENSRVFIINVANDRKLLNKQQSGSRFQNNTMSHSKNEWGNKEGHDSVGGSHQKDGSASKLQKS